MSEKNKILYFNTKSTQHAGLDWCLLGVSSKGKICGIIYYPSKKLLYVENLTRYTYKKKKKKKKKIYTYMLEMRSMIFKIWA